MRRCRLVPGWAREAGARWARGRGEGAFGEGGDASRAVEGRAWAGCRGAALLGMPCAAIAP